MRWLSRWCRGGHMREDLLGDFCKMMRADPDAVLSIPGLDWTFSETKLNAIAWLDHILLGRPFLWVEDAWGVGERERRFLADHGFEGAWRPCNVTEDPESLRSLHRRLIEEGR